MEVNDRFAAALEMEAAAQDDAENQESGEALRDSELKSEQEQAEKVPAIDVFIYSGAINRQGYHHLCSILDNEPPEEGAQEALLILGTSGGDADAAFRIARALHHHYKKRLQPVHSWLLQISRNSYCNRRKVVNNSRRRRTGTSRCTNFQAR